MGAGDVDDRRPIGHTRVGVIAVKRPESRRTGLLLSAPPGVAISSRSGSNVTLYACAVESVRGLFRITYRCAEARVTGPLRLVE